jgi:hypothetical protein
VVGGDGGIVFDFEGDALAGIWEVCIEVSSRDGR